MSESRYKCDCCGWIGLDSDLLTSPSPFRDDDILIACPKCRMTEGFTELCDFCDSPATCGTPTLDGYYDEDAYSKGTFKPDGYVRTCGKHRPSKKVG